MNPIMKCCGYYCSCITLVGIVFFGILIGLIKSHNPWLTKEFPHDIDTRVEALVIAIIANAVCFGLCVTCVVIGTCQEIKAQKNSKEDEDFNFGMKQNQ
jgi:multisubunit Na+/H+ antiporter MnhC subunit